MKVTEAPLQIHLLLRHHVSKIFILMLFTQFMKSYPEEHLSNLKEHILQKT